MIAVVLLCGYGVGVLPCQGGTREQLREFETVQSGLVHTWTTVGSAFGVFHAVGGWDGVWPPYTLGQAMARWTKYEWNGGGGGGGLDDVDDVSRCHPKSHDGEPDDGEPDVGLDDVGLDGGSVASARWWMEGVYGVSIGYYVVMTGWLLVIKMMQKRDGYGRHDIGLKLVHHGVSLGLMVVSWVFHLRVYGLVVLFLHDVSDPFLNFGIYITPASKHDKRIEVAQITAFVVFVIAWILARVVALPVFIWSCIVPPLHIACGSTPHTPSMHALLLAISDPPPLSYLPPLSEESKAYAVAGCYGGAVSVLLLGAVFVFTMMWTKYIITTAANLLSGKRLLDTRQNSE